MAKDKKSKKGRRDENTVVDVINGTADLTLEDTAKPPHSSCMDDDDDTASSTHVDLEPIEPKSKKKNKKKHDIDMSETNYDDLSSDKPSVTAEKGESKQSVPVLDSGFEQNELDDEMLDMKETKRDRKKKKKGSTQGAAEDTKAIADDDLDADEIHTVKTAAQKKKEKKERERLKKLEQMGGNYGEKDDDTASSTHTDLGQIESKSKKKGRKKDDIDMSETNSDNQSLDRPSVTPERDESEPNVPIPDTGLEQNELDDEMIDEKETKRDRKKKKKDSVQAATEDAKSVVDDMDADEGHTVKTAAQKKKEKKERERLKKLEQNKTKKVPGTSAQARMPSEEPLLGEAEEKELKEQKENEKDDKDEPEDKKKKKKKEKGEKVEDEKKKKDRPGKKQIAAMQEALKKLKEEEERLRLEEEAKLKAEEEAEMQRQEKLRLEQERKEKKKQKEKEKRLRLKAEGKLLTKTERQNRARVEATLAALRMQGVEVPQIGEKKERAPRLGDRKKPSKKKIDATTEEVDVNSEDQVQESESCDLSPSHGDADKSIDICEAEKEEDDVKDAWDESSEEESEISSRNENEHKCETDESDSEDDDKNTSESETSSSESEEELEKEEVLRQRAVERIRKRREDAEVNRSTSKLRSPVVCVLGHVDTGKTKILDKIRRTHVQSNEAGGITQQIGATMVPQDALREQCKMVKNFSDIESDLRLPGLLIIDTPGHESFSNLRSRGSSLCDIAILVVDIMHGLEPQTIESINLLKEKKTPFIVALNKVDRIYQWKSMPHNDIQEVIKSQARNTKLEFEDRAKEVILEFATQGLNAVLYYENTNPRSYISMVPTSAVTGDGMGNLMALSVHLIQTMMVKRVAFSEELQATVLEVKSIPGLGTTIDVILVNGRLREGDTIVLAGYEGVVITQIRSILMPQPLKELRVKNPYEEYKEVEGAQGVKITGKDLDKAIAGLQILVAHHPDEVPVLKDEVNSMFKEAMSAIKLTDRGVYVVASTLGSLEALLDFLRTSKIPYSGIRIGPVVKKDVMKASIMLEHDSQYAVILAFDVKIEKDAQELADSLGVKVFQADIIYHLFDKFTAYRDELRNKKRDEYKSIAVFPCKLRILPQYVFNTRDPIILGVVVEAGILKDGTPLCVPSKEFVDIGTVSTIEVNHKAMESARKGQEVCIKIEPLGGEAPKMFGRHFDHTDLLVSKISRQSIDICKEHFREDLQKTDWQLMLELKKTFQIL